MRIITLFTACALTATSLIASAQGSYDVSRVFLVNTGFDSGFNYVVGDEGNVRNEVLPVKGWTNSTTNKYLVSGVYQLGTAKTFLNTPIPATGHNGTADGGVFVLVPDWGTIARYHQEVTLTPGTYKLKANVYNGGNTSNTNTFLAWIPKSGSRTQTRQNSFETGQWSIDSIEFTVSATTKGSIQIGYRIFQSELTGQRALLMLDNLQLLRDHDADATDTEAQRDGLLDVISEATTLLGDGTHDNAALLKAAIESAQGVADNDAATPEELNNARLNLRDEIQLFPISVSTDGFVRGATAALGRLSYKDATNSLISSIGFAVEADDVQPTVEGTAAEGITVRTLSHNGELYVIEGLKPATKYYYRPYVRTSTGSVRYGQAVKFYTIPKGQITYGIRDISDAATRERITNATKSAVDYWNTWTEIKDQYFNVGNDNVPTADCSYGGYIRVGNNTSYQATGTLLHEMLHGVGVIPWADTQWARFDLRGSTSNGAGFTTGSGDWLGDRTSYAVRFLTNGGDQRLHGDYQHMWPYGINGASEDNHSEALYIGNSVICQALGEDGLEHNASHFAAPYYALEQEDDVKYYIKNEADNGGYLVDRNTSSATLGTLSYEQQADVTANDSAAWYVTFTPGNQYYQIRNAATGRYLTFSSSFNTRQVNAPAANQDFQLMKARVDAVEGQNVRGFWVLRHAARTPSGLGLNAQGKISRITFDIGNDATSQRWLFLDADALKAFNAVTGISNVSVGGHSTARPVPHDIYNLNGQLVRKDAQGTQGLDKGIYIMDGKKFVVK